MAAFPNWEVSVLRALRLPVNGRNVRWLSAWQRAEGGSAAFNPLNTTQSAPGASSYNSVGVRNYRNPQQGLEATIRTLQNGRYRGILDTLANPGASGFDFAHAIGASPWGTSGDLVAKVLGSPLPEQAQMQIHSKSAPPPAPDFRDIIMRQLGAQLFPGLPPLDSPNPAVPRPSESQLPRNGTLNVGKSVVGVVDDALKQQGVKYVWGGSSPKGFDCSGLLYWAFAQHGIQIPRTSEEQWSFGKPVRSVARARPGDAFFYRPESGGPGHVAMYIGKGKVVVAPHTGDVVHVVPWNSIGQFMGIRRFA